MGFAPPPRDGFAFSWATAIACLREPYNRPLGWVGFPRVCGWSPIYGVIGANCVSGVDRAVAILPVQRICTTVTCHHVSSASILSLELSR
jgi:hypothetical protein